MWNSSLYKKRKKFTVNSAGTENCFRFAAKTQTKIFSKDSFISDKKWYKLQQYSHHHILRKQTA